MTGKSSFYASTGPTYTGTNPASSSNDGEIGVVFDGGSGALTADAYIDIPITFGCQVQSATLWADASGSAVVDIRVATPPTAPTASICASAKPTLSSAQYSKDATLTGWTVDIAPDQIVR